MATITPGAHTLKQIPKWVVLQKKRGETPLEVLSAWKAQRPELAEVPASYAGRLDPMAEGKLLVLLGDECKRQSAYTKLDKEYEVEVLLDFGTDTGDALGIARFARQKEPSEKSLNTTVQEQVQREKFLNTNETFPSTPAASTSQLRQVLLREVGKHSRKYPVFSSKTVQGKPLFLYALEGKLDTITIPEHVETIYRIKHVGSYELSISQLHARIQDLLKDVPRSDEPSKALGADFRQDEIRARWNELFTSIQGETLNQFPKREFTVLKICVTCASGAYMRTLAERIGTAFGSTGLALTINRTKIGKYHSLGSVGFWSKLYL